MDTAESRLKMLQDSGRAKNNRRTDVSMSIISGAKLRFMLALVLFLLFCLMEKKDWSIMGITGEKIYETVCENAKGFDFVLDFPYTLDN